MTNMLYPIIGLAILSLLLGGMNVVQCSGKNALEEQITTLTAAKDAAVANTATATESATAWETTATDLNGKLKACVNEKDLMAEQNRIALENTRRALRESDRAFDAWVEKYAGAAQSSKCSALLNTPICDEALPDE